MPAPFVLTFVKTDGGDLIPPFFTSQSPQRHDNPVTLRVRGLLMCGRNPSLMKLRRLVLAHAGYDLEILTGTEETRRRLAHSAGSYWALVICHSVPPYEASTLREAAAQARVAVYELSKLLPPERLIQDIEALWKKTHMPEWSDGQRPGRSC